MLQVTAELRTLLSNMADPSIAARVAAEAARAASAGDETYAEDEDEDEDEDGDEYEAGTARTH